MIGLSLHLLKSEYITFKSGNNIIFLLQGEFISIHLFIASLV